MVSGRGAEDQRTGGSSSLLEKPPCDLGQGADFTLLTCTGKVSGQVTSRLLSAERAHRKFKYHVL